jgi:hypothetical protein
MMKEFCFSGYGVFSEEYYYTIEITSADLEEYTDISAEELEAMTEEEMKAYVQNNFYIIDNLIKGPRDHVGLKWVGWEYENERDFDLNISGE